MHAAFEYVTNSKEIFAALLTAFLSGLGFLILRIFAAKPKLHYAIVHSSHLLPKNDQGQLFSVYSADYVFYSVGRRMCDSVEFVFNFPPQHFEIFPHLAYTTHLNPDNRLIVKIESLNPGENFRVRMLNSVVELPAITNVRFKGGPGRLIIMEQQKRHSKLIQFGVAFLLLVGIMALIYAPVRLAQVLF